MNQDVGLPIPGEVLACDANTAMFMASLVPFEDPHAPFAPRGVIAVGNSLYVADAGNFDDAHPGQVLRYSLADGSFQGRVDRSGFDKLFAPRGLVLGLDWRVYASVT